MASFLKLLHLQTAQFRISASTIHFALHTGISCVGSHFLITDGSLWCHMCHGFSRKVRSNILWILFMPRLWGICCCVNIPVNCLGWRISIFLFIPLYSCDGLYVSCLTGADIEVSLECSKCSIWHYSHLYCGLEDHLVSGHLCSHRWWRYGMIWLAQNDHCNFVIAAGPCIWYMCSFLIVWCRYPVVCAAYHVVCSMFQNEVSLIFSVFVDTFCAFISALWHICYKHEVGHWDRQGAVLPLIRMEASPGLWRLLW